MDPISDMLIRIKNAQNAKKPEASFSYSKIKFGIAQVLEKEGYLGVIEKRGRKNGKLIDAKLLYNGDGSPKIGGVARISKPSRRVYRSYREIYSPKGGSGLAIYSTSKGLLTNGQARKQKLGGEILFEIW